MRNSSTSYGLVAQAFHWLVALFIFWAIALGLVVEDMPDSPDKIKLYILHKSAGITVLVLVLGRILWRIFNPPPELELDKKSQLMAGVGHLGLYALMILVPLTGWLLNSALGYPLPWFNWLPVPAIPGVGKSSAEFFESAHVALFYALAIAVLGHIAMIVVHNRLHKLNLLPRMLPGGRVGALALWSVGLMALIIWTVLQSSVKPAEIKKVSAANVQIETPAEAALITSESPAWAMVAEQSKLEFKATYAGEPFTGEIATFVPAIYFDPALPDAGVIDVQIETSSLTTRNDEWDSMIGAEEWFDFSQFPKAHFLSQSITQEADGFVANGTLTLKGETQPLAVRFNWQAEGQNARFIGAAEIDRRVFNVGSGTWAEDDSVGFTVVLDIDLLLTQQ